MGLNTPLFVTQPSWSSIPPSTHHHLIPVPFCQISPFPIHPTTYILSPPLFSPASLPLSIFPLTSHSSKYLISLTHISLPYLLPSLLFSSNLPPFNLSPPPLLSTSLSLPFSSPSLLPSQSFSSLTCSLEPLEPPWDYALPSTHSASPLTWHTTHTIHTIQYIKKNEIWSMKYEIKNKKW